MEDKRATPLEPAALTHLEVREHPAHVRQESFHLLHEVQAPARLILEVRLQGKRAVAAIITQAAKLARPIDDALAHHGPDGSALFQRQVLETGVGDEVFDRSIALPDRIDLGTRPAGMGRVRAVMHCVSGRSVKAEKLGDGSSRRRISSDASVVTGCLLPSVRMAGLYSPGEMAVTVTPWSRTAATTKSPAQAGQSGTRQRQA